MSENYRVGFIKCEGCGFDRLAYYDFNGEIEEIEDCCICEILKQDGQLKKMVQPGLPAAINKTQPELPFQRSDEMFQQMKGW